MKTCEIKKYIARVVIAVFAISLFSINAFAAEGWRQTIEIGSLYNDEGVISIDLTKTSNVSLGLQFMDTVDSTTNVSLTMIRLTKSGKLAFRNNGGWISQEDENNASFERADFKAGIKYNLKMKHDKESGLIEWYLNNEKIGETQTEKNSGLCDRVWVMCTEENMNKLNWTVNMPGEENINLGENYDVDEEALNNESKLFTDVQDSADSNALKLLTALGVMAPESESGRLWDETPVRRREIAEILCKLLNLNESKDPEPLFDDVKEEHRAYVETVVRNGYMSGYGEREFGANDYITNEQLIKIFVTVMGGANMAELSGGYPTGYLTIARKLDIIGSLKIGSETPAKRIDVANIIYSTLEADALTIDYINGENTKYTSVDGYTFLSDRLGIYRIDGVVKANGVTALNDSNGLGEGRVQVGESVHNDPQNLAKDYLGCLVTAYAKIPKKSNTGDIVCICEDSNNKSMTISAEDFVDTDGFKFSYTDTATDKVKSVTLAPGTNMIYNGKAIEYNEKEFNFDIGTIKLINSDGDGKFDTALITSYEDFVVEKVNTADKTISLKYSGEIIELDKNCYSVNKNGETSSLDKIGIGEVISVASSKNSDSEKVIEIEVCSERISASVDRMYEKNGFEYAVIDGKEYKIGSACKEFIKSGFLPDLKVGNSGQFFTDIFGNVVHYNRNTSNIKVGYLVRYAVCDEVFGKSLKLTIYNENDEFEELAAYDELKINGTKKDISNLGSDVETKLKKRGLVEYSAKDGELTLLNLAVDGYDVDNFSIDDSYDKRGTYIKCTSTSVLDHKYSVTASTKVFIVPRGSVDVMESAYYNIRTGTYFVGNNNYNVYLYDISSSNEVSCAMVEVYPPSSSSLNEYTGIALVSDVAEGINEDGEIVPIVSVFAESGQEIKLTGMTMSQINVSSANSQNERALKMGDVIQYSTNKKGKISAIKLIHDSENETYYSPSAVEESKTNYTVAKVFGQAIRATSSQVFVSCSGIWENMTPFDTDMLVSNTGAAVFVCDYSKGNVTKALFNDANRGDNVFAVVNTSNKTRMFVIYK